MKGARVFDSRKNSIRKRIFNSFALVNVPLLVLLGAVAYLVASQTMQRYIIQSSRQIVTQAILHIDYNIRSYEHDSLGILGNQTVIDFLKLGTDDLYEIYIQSNQIKESLFNPIIHNKEEVEGIFLGGVNGLVISAGTGEERFALFEGERLLATMEWIKEVPSTGAMLITGVHQQSYGREIPVITLARRISNPQNPSEVLGFFWIDLNLNRIKEICHNVRLGKTGYLAVFSPFGDIIYLPGRTAEREAFFRALIREDNDYFLQEFEDNKTMIISQEAPVTGWVVKAVVPYNEAAGGMIWMQYLTGAVVLLCLVISLSISRRFSRSITGPIERLEAMMNEAAGGYLDGVISVDNTDEIGRLTHNFNRMLEKIKNLIKDVYQSRVKQLEAETRQKEAELKALQAQINPHFLFNTLSIINSMAVLENNTAVSDTVEILGDFLRYAIETDEIVVPLAQEIAQVKRYLSIQKMRFGERISLKLNIPDECLEKPVIKLSLQPLVENACIHGLELKNGNSRGLITIEAFFHGDNLVIIVEDNGKGLSARELQVVNASLEDRASEKTEAHVGLRNVHRRLKVHYSPDAGLVIQNRSAGGARVTMVIPQTG